MFLVSEIEQYFFSCHWSGYAIPQRWFNKKQENAGICLSSSWIWYRQTPMLKWAEYNTPRAESIAAASARSCMHIHLLSTSVPTAIILQHFEIGDFDSKDKSVERLLGHCGCHKQKSTGPQDNTNLVIIFQKTIFLYNKTLHPTLKNSFYPTFDC